MINKNEVIRKRPDCELCHKPESGLVVIQGMLICGGCCMKIQRAKQEEMKELIKNG